jgi:hypothetical protein
MKGLRTKQVLLFSIFVAFIAFACGKNQTAVIDAAPPSSAGQVVEKEGIRLGGPVCIPGTGTGQAQDATAQCIAAAYGLTIPTGGTGTGLCQDATLQAILGAISGGGGGAKTAATVVSGQTYNLLTTDAVIRFDTSGGTTGTANMHAPGYIGQQVTFYWWSWNGAQAAPTMNVDAGHKMVPFSGQAIAGAAGLVTTDTISTPGASITREWDGTEWTTL